MIFWKCWMFSCCFFYIDFEKLEVWNFEKLKNWNFEIFEDFENLIFFFWKMLKNDLGIANMFFKWFWTWGWISDFLFFWVFRFLFFFGSKTLKTHQNDGFRSRGPSKNARGYRFHAYKLSNHHITSILDIVFMFSFEKHDRKNDVW